MRDKQPVLAVIGVLLAVIGFVWVANVVTAPKPASTSATSDPTSSAGATSTADPSVTSTASASQTPTPTPKVLAGCTEVPAPQAAPKKMTSAPDIEAVRGKTFIATITTNCGVVTVELDGAKAPATVSSFVLLGNAGYWAPSPCHRLTGDEQGLWVLQCGDPTGTGAGPGPGYHYGIENAPADGKYPAGTLAMARTSDPNSATAQFFINLKDNAFLNHTAKTPRGWGYTVFGRVTEGMAVVDAIGGLPTGSKGPFPTDVPQETVIIEKASRVGG